MTPCYDIHLVYTDGISLEMLITERAIRARDITRMGEAFPINA